MRYEANEAIYFGLCNTVSLKRGVGLFLRVSLFQKITVHVNLICLIELLFYDPMIFFGLQVEMDFQHTHLLIHSYGVDYHLLLHLNYSCGAFRR